MAFNVMLYKFNKRPNSTKRPTASDKIKEVSCTLKTSSSVLNPVLTLNLTAADALDFNYMYIPQYQRYYYIDDIEYSQALFNWEIYAHVDVLATYRSDIKTSNQFIARSSTNFDANIIDNMYLTKVSGAYGRCAVSKASGSVNVEVVGESGGSTISYFNRAYTAGDFVVGVAGNNGTGATYYQMSYSVFKEFIQKAFALNPSDMSNVDTGIANAIWSPLDYIINARWFPKVKLPAGASGTTTIRLGRYGVSLTNSAYLLNANNVVEYSMTIDIPKHPDSSTRPYLNLSPYTDMYLYFLPFGNIPLDTTKLYGDNKLGIRWYTDYISGSATLELYPYNGVEDDCLIYTDSAEFGVSIPISSMNYSVENGAIVTALAILKESTKPSAMTYSEQFKDTKNIIIQAAAGLADAGKWAVNQIFKNDSNVDILGKVSDAASASLGKLQTRGAPGSFMMYNSGYPYIYAWFQFLTGTDDSRFGRPYYQFGSMSYHENGFVSCLNASITSYTSGPVPLSPECGAVINYLNSGIYLE